MNLDHRLFEKGDEKGDEKEKKLLTEQVFKSISDNPNITLSALSKLLHISKKQA